MTTPTCRFCGREFKASPGGTTVHCPAHRTAASRRVEKTTTSGPKTVSPAGHTCTVRSAVTGACGKPAVFAFVSERAPGEVFAECSEHH